MLVFWIIKSRFLSILLPNQKKGFPDGSVVQNPPANAGDKGSISGSGRSLEKEMATHSNILAWRIPWTEEPGWAIVHRVPKSRTQVRTKQQHYSLQTHFQAIFLHSLNYARARPCYSSFSLLSLFSKFSSS